MRQARSPELSAQTVGDSSEGFGHMRRYDILLQCSYVAKVTLPTGQTVRNRVGTRKKLAIAGELLDIDRIRLVYLRESDCFRALSAGYQALNGGGLV